MFTIAIVGRQPISLALSIPAHGPWKIEIRLCCQIMTTFVRCPQLPNAVECHGHARMSPLQAVVSLTRLPLALLIAGRDDAAQLPLARKALAQLLKHPEKQTARVHKGLPRGYTAVGLDADEQVRNVWVGN